MQNEKKNNNKVKMTLLLDDEALRLIRQYGAEKLGSKSISASIRAMAREYGKCKKADDK